jgi:hypothetical protein
MQLQLEPQKIDWWYWTITFIFIGFAVIGWSTAYYIVMLISAVQIVHFRKKYSSVINFDLQVRIVYFAFTLLGLISSIRTIVYILLLIGTFMVVAFNRCGIALLLKKMPWNKNQTVNIQR